MKKISLRQSNLDMEYKGKVIRFHGELGSSFIAWINSTEWLSNNTDAPMTVNEKLEIMRVAHKYVWDGSYRTVFVDDECKAIFFDYHGNPLVYIDDENIKSSKVNISCICDTFEEVDGFSPPEFELWLMDVMEWTKNKAIHKVHVWKKYGQFKEEWYKCKKCETVWRLVYPKGSFKGLWKKVN